jgi:hypothetical protein
MPYLRLYSRGLPLEQKRVVAQKLIEITLRTFHLRADERNRITIQFITEPKLSGVDGFQPVLPRDADFTLEVISHDLTERKKRAFGEGVSTMLAPLLPVKPWRRLARLLRIEKDTAQKIALQFNRLSPAISDPFVVHPDRRVA